MMRRLGKLALVTAAAVLMASPALAQRQPGRGPGMFGGGGGIGLLTQAKVQEELKLSDKQKEELKTVGEKIGAKVREAMQGLDFQPGTPPSPEMMQKMQETMKPINEEAMKEVAKVLDEKQNKRFKELRFQASAQQGASAFTQPEVQTELKLTDEQKTKIGEIVKDMEKERRELFQGGFSPETRQKMQTLNKESYDKANDVLTADQKKQWKAMQGEPFKFDPPGGRPRTDR